jgi:hypothetical protein
MCLGLRTCFDDRTVNGSYTFAYILRSHWDLIRPYKGHSLVLNANPTDNLQSGRRFGTFKHGVSLLSKGLCRDDYLLRSGMNRLPTYWIFGQFYILTRLKWLYLAMSCCCLQKAGYCFRTSPELKFRHLRGCWHSQRWRTLRYRYTEHAARRHLPLNGVTDTVVIPWSTICGPSFDNRTL